MNKPTLIYDIEVKNTPKSSDDWRRYDWLGITCITCWSSWRGFDAFPECNVFAFQQVSDEAVEHGAEVCGFNSSRFDDEVCKANGITIKTTYDLLLESWRAAGLDPDYSFPKDDPPERRAKYAGFKLEDLARANLPYGKSLSGSKAPEEWRKGNYRKVLDYCLGDVEITRKCLKFGLQGKLWHAGTRQFLKLRGFR